MARGATFDYNEADIQCCLFAAQGGYFAHMNWDAVVELESGLHWLSSTLSFGEDISISSCACDRLPATETVIGYCEIQLVGAHLHKKRGGDILRQAQPIRGQPHGIYRPEHDRLDFKVSPPEMRAAYESVRALGTGNGQRRQGEATLFDVLHVRLVKSRPVRRSGAEQAAV